MKAGQARGATPRHFRRTLLLAGASLAVACARSPEPAFYALSARGGGALATRALVIVLRRPTLPPYLDRPHVVRRVSAEELALDGGARWAAPLPELVIQALGEDLSARLPRCFVVREASAMAIDADVQVDLAFSRFDAGDAVTELAAVVAVRPARADRRPELRRYDFKLASATSASAIAANLSTAVGQLSDAIARMIADPAVGKEASR